MRKEEEGNIVTTIIAGLFSFIATGYAWFDNFFKRLVSLTLLLVAVIWVVSTLGNSLHIGTSMVSAIADSAILASEPARTEAGILVDELVVAGGKLVDETSIAVGLSTDPAKVLQEAQEAASSVVGEVPQAVPLSE